LQPKAAAEHVSEVARVIAVARSGQVVAAYHGTPPILEKSSRRSVPDQRESAKKFPKNSWLVPAMEREFLPPKLDVNNGPTIKTNFTLTVVVTRDIPGWNYQRLKWNDAGNLVAAPSPWALASMRRAQPVYFPVMNSLLPSETTRTVDSETLARNQDGPRVWSCEPHCQG